METLALDRQGDHSFVALEQRVNELIRLCERLIADNQTLREQQTALLAERQHLVEQHEQSRARIDAIMARLKGLEQPS